MKEYLLVFENKIIIKADNLSELNKKLRPLKEKMKKLGLQITDQSGFIKESGHLKPVKSLSK